MAQGIMLEAEGDPAEVEVATTRKAEMNTLPTVRPTSVDRTVIGFRRKDLASSTAATTKTTVGTTIKTTIRDLVSIRALVKLAEPRVTPPQVMVGQGI